MPVRIASGGRTTGQIAKLGLLVVAMLLVAALVDGAFAQGSPFGGPRPGACPVPASGILGWLFAMQAEFYRQFSGLIRASKADGSAAWTLMGLSFLYGIFHAAGPGHGKAVISSYLVANEETWVRGVVLSLLSALMQAFVAIAIVGVAAVLLHVSAAKMNSAVNWIETLSYALIIVVGAAIAVGEGARLRGGAARSRPPDRRGRGRGDAGPRRMISMTITIITSMITIMITRIAITRTTITPPPRRLRPVLTAITTTIMTTGIRTMITIMTMMPPHGGMPTRPSPRSSPDPAAGGAGSPPSWRSGCGRARAPSWCWSSRSPRVCSGWAWHRPS